VGVRFCTIVEPNKARVQKRTVCGRFCIIVARDEEMVHFGTPTFPTQRS
jgi:hypothetical protein